MRVNADFTKAVTVPASAREWVASPAAGVERAMLDRIGGEVARATTIVRFAPNSYFDSHTHTGGEEFVVLKGVFSDQYGDFPAGTYVRNPIGTAHKPHTDDGCEIFVKLWQFDPADDRQFSVDLNAAELTETEEGDRAAVLHQFGDEHVSLREAHAGSSAEAEFPGGAEVLLLHGDLAVNGQNLELGGWARLPVGASATITSEAGGRYWRKTGHLIQPPSAPTTA